MEPFKIHILGCGSALPTTRHYSSMQVVECRGKLFMIDCGEGAQLQIRRSSISFERLGHIFISHIHGDHCFGLIGLISTFGLLGRNATLHIHAPMALETILKAQLQLFFNYDIGYQVEFHPIDTNVQKVIYEDHSLTVETIPLDHRMPCAGFLFREKALQPHIRRDMIDMYGIPVSQINNIKAGQDYTLPDGTVIANERLVTPPDKPRSYAYCSDTRYMPQLHEMIQDVNTLYHESTYAQDKLEGAAKYYHSTAQQAAMVARDANAGKLLLGHYSARYADETVLLNEAKEVFPNSYLTNEMDVFDV
ncbi:MAG: ribonuclease Z [Prevotella sp.]|nr:ribonuclease Z [Prevotella sp.]